MIKYLSEKEYPEVRLRLKIKGSSDKKMMKIYGAKLLIIQWPNRSQLLQRLRKGSKRTITMRMIPGIRLINKLFSSSRETLKNDKK